MKRQGKPPLQNTDPKVSIKRLIILSETHKTIKLNSCFSLDYFQSLSHRVNRTCSSSLQKSWKEQPIPIDLHFLSLSSSFRQYTLKDGSHLICSLFCCWTYKETSEPIHIWLYKLSAVNKWIAKEVKTFKRNTSYLAPAPTEGSQEPQPCHSFYP